MSQEKIKIDFEENSLYINYSNSSYIDFDSEMDIIKNIFFDIELVNDFTQERKTIGTGELLHIDLSMQMNHKLSLYEQLDNHSPELLNLGEAIFKEDEEIIDFDYWNSFNFSKDLNLINEDNFNSNILHIQRIEIDEKYQNNNVGSLFLKHLHCNFYDQFLFITTKPYPLEFEGNMNTDEEIDNNKEMYEYKMGKVISFYLKNGFSKISDSDFYYAPSKWKLN